MTKLDGPGDHPRGRAIARRVGAVIAPITVAFAITGCGGGGAEATRGATAAAAPTAASAAPTATAAAPTAALTAAPTTAAPTATVAAPAATVTAPTAAPLVTDIGVPTRLRIAAIGVDAAVEQVGLDAENAMDVPQEPRNTAWYRYGPRPGQPGHAVIGGHVDYRGIGPVVFYRLPELTVGQEIVVVDEHGAERRFVVTSNEVFPRQKAPVERIFGPASGPRLVLITCDRESTFDRDRREYTNNIVVFAEPVS